MVPGLKTSCFIESVFLAALAEALAKGRTLKNEVLTAFAREWLVPSTLN